MTPQISIIIPSYNTQLPLLYRAIHSALNQTFAPLEVIICDDGSTIPIYEAVRNYFKPISNYPSIIITTHQKNLGISAARNSGASCASGDWLCWLDADDTLHEDCLNQLQVSCRNSKMVIGDCDLYVDGNHFQRRLVSDLERRLRDHHRTARDPFLTQVTSLQPQLFCKNTFFQLGGFSVEYQYAEVTELFLRFLATFGADEVRFSPKGIYNYTYQAPHSWSRARDALFDHRYRALDAYRQAINVDGQLVYQRRDFVSGFQIYELQCERGKKWTEQSNSRASMVQI